MSRLGLTVSTKIGTAVTRNRIRRRYKEIYRLNEDKLEPGYDIVIVTRGKSRLAPFSELQTDFFESDEEARRLQRCHMKKLLIAAVRFYRKYISPATPPSCRFIPTCSEYALEALEKYGALRGFWLALKRFSKCHPFHKGGYDPLP